MGSFSAEGQFFNDWDPRFVPVFGFCFFLYCGLFDTVDIFCSSGDFYSQTHEGRNVALCSLTDL